jgi:hypothetical protein
MSDEAMRSLVKSDGDDYRDRPGRDKIYCLAAHDLRNLIFLLAALSGMDGPGWLPAGDWASNRLIQSD